MKKSITITCMVISCLTFAGDILNINGKFTKPVNNIPENWIMNTALPGEIKVSKEDSRNILEVTSTKKQVHIYSKLREPAVAGDKIKISVNIKGSGKAILGLYLYDDNGKWIGTNMLRTFEAEPDWKPLEVVCDLKNFNNKTLGTVCVVLGVQKNSTISFAELKAVKTPIAPATSNKPATNSNSLELTLPREFYGTPGVESGIYLDNIILTEKPESYTLKIKPNNIGKTENTHWSITPTPQQVGEHMLDVIVSAKDDKDAVQAKTILKIAPATAGKGKKITLLIIGDSLTAGTYYSMEIGRLLSLKDNPKWTMLGSNKKPNGIAHEGYGGWTWHSFITKYVKEPVKRAYRGSSPFVFLSKNGKPQLDVNRYFNEKCDGVKPDVITILLGINDCFVLQRKLNSPGAVDKGIENVFKNAEILLKELRKVAPHAIIGICLTPPPNTREKAFFANYKGSYHRWTWKQVQHRLVQRQIQHFGNREKENIYIIPTELNIDCVDGYPDNNGVHPNKKGYDQIGSSIYCWLKWQLYKNTILK